VKTATEEIEKNKVLLKVEVPVEEVEASLSKAYKKIAAKTNIPGFRKGKAPPEVIESRLGKEVVYNEALQEMLPRCYLRAVEEAGIEPVSGPEIKVIQIEKDKPLLFNAKVHIKPEVKLGKYTQIEVTKEALEVTEAAIDEQIERLREKFAKVEVVKEERPLAKGDFALIDFKGYQGDQPLEGANATDFLLQVGSGALALGLEEKLIGMKKGENREIELTYPDDCPTQELAGKKVKFDVLVKEIKEKVLPEVNDDFAKEVSKFNTFEELKADLRKRLEEGMEKVSQARLRRDILSKVVEKAEVDLPQVMIDERVQEMIKGFAFELEKQGLTLERYLEATQTDMSVLEGRFREQAIDDIKTELVLEAVAKAEEITVSDEELDEELNKYAQDLQADFNQFKKMIIKRGDLPFIRWNILSRKTIDWLYNQAKITESKD